MYYDTINIIFSNNSKSGINFQYDFLISKSETWLNNWQNYEQSHHKNHIISYKDIFKKFQNIGLNTDYIKFPKLENKNQEVYCSYNYFMKGDYRIFFRAWERSLKNQDFNISFHYGSMINGEFYRNNMNSFSSVSFYKYIEKWMVKRDKIPTEMIFDNIEFLRAKEAYSIVNSKGKIIHELIAHDDFNKAKEEFFKEHKVAVYLRKYKLKELMYNN